jgi:hypothetical protein
MPDPAYWEDAEDEIQENNQDEDENRQEDLGSDLEPSSF